MKKTIYIILVLFLSSCAYKPARIIEYLPEANQKDQQTSGSVQIEMLEYETINETQPRYVRRKLRNKEITLLPVYIKNQGLDSFMFNYNQLELFVDYEKVSNLSNKKTLKVLKQHQVKTLPWHIISAWFIMGYLKTDVSLNHTIKTNPWPFITGPIGIYNVMKIRKANRTLQNELAASMVDTKLLGPGDELIVIVAVNTLITDEQQVNIRLADKL